MTTRWDESWPEWAKKNPRVPEDYGGREWAELQSFTKAKLQEIKNLATPELAVMHLCCEIGELFERLEPVEAGLAELSKQLAANLSEDGSFRPGFDSAAHLAKI